MIRVFKMLGRCICNKIIHLSSVRNLVIVITVMNVIFFAVYLHTARFISVNYDVNCSTEKNVSVAQNSKHILSHSKLNKQTNFNNIVNKTRSVISTRAKPKLILFWEPYKYFSENFVKRCRYPCVSSSNKSLLKEADAVVMHGWMFPRATVPTYRTQNQRWVYLINESPVNTYYYSKHINYTAFNGIFNWTMTYRRDSDIRHKIWSFVKLDKNDKVTYNFDYARNKTKFAMALISNCKNKERNELVRKMQEYAPNLIDFYGRCGKQCEKNCTDLLKEYKFVLAFENSFYCKDYITEKFWQNSLMKGAVPIAKGGRKENYLNHNPPAKSFIHVDDFPTVKDLVEFMLYLSKNPDKYNEYHKWRNEYKINANYVSHWCELCNKLHEDSEPKVYENFEKWYNSCENYHFK